MQIGHEQVIASFRRSSARWWGIACFAGFGLVGLSMATVSDGDHERNSVYSSHSAFAISERVFGGLIALGAAYLIIRWIRAGIFVTGTHVVARNTFRTAIVKWSEVDHFSRPANYGVWTRAGLQIHLRDGTIVFASLFSAGPFNRTTFADSVILKLEQLRPPGATRTTS